MAKIGLASINVIFIQKAKTAIRNSEKGIVMLLLKDSSVTGKDFTYLSYDKATNDGWSETNLKYLEFCFKGNPNKVYVRRLESDYELSEELKTLSNKRWNYLAFAESTEEEKALITTWVKAKRDIDHKIYKYVGGGLLNADHEGIINFDSDNIIIEGIKYSKDKYTTRIAGLCAGMPLTESATYQVLTEVEGFDELEDDVARNEAIGSGKLILLNDGEKCKIARGVNSLQTTTNTKGDLFKKIRAIETIDTIREDITTTIQDEWIGKNTNSYDNKLLLAGAITTYLKLLAKDELLDSDFENKCTIDIEAQKEYLISQGVNIEDMEDLAILKYNTGDKVFLNIQIKMLDTMEDFKINIYI